MVTRTERETLNPIIEYAECYDRVKELERRKKEEEARLKALEELALRHFTEEGARATTLNDGRTVYIQTDTRLSLKDDSEGTKDTAHRVLRKRGLAYMVKNNVNLNSLRSWYIMQVKEETPIHREIMDVLNVHEIDSLRVSRSRSGARRKTE